MKKVKSVDIILTEFYRRMYSIEESLKEVPDKEKERLEGVVYDYNKVKTRALCHLTLDVLDKTRRELWEVLNSLNG